ncbi:hypothetical protein FHS04_000850 [Mesoflavibacter sabulilitoris]|uniref:Uncharacterized protein n=1 Tax=Mesoflavibacter zeaxanthinifaciens subsp. sabulilitoris TaxID=1520893 RepID=A0A2T1N655_9FLAO|nr:hypothetical protein [Mesoflavibacter zeaxanthinifaciens subsp. sabulilitoris]PSG87014.1 hypothetical protein C7H61_12960 [Mesoflavibacter zeaxanthinifaciens subsp. sabulilitoris]
MFFNLFHSKKNDFNSINLPISNFNELIGLTKNELTQKLGISYNDIHCNVWMYYLYPKRILTKKNCLYLLFKKGKVEKYYLTRFKTTKFQKHM